MVKIRTRLCLGFLILVGLGFYALVDWVLDDLRPRYLETMEESMVDIATLLSSFVSDSVEEGALGVDDLRSAFEEAQKRRFSAKIYQLTKTQVNMWVYITNRKGIVVFDSDDGKDEGKDYSQWNDVIRTMRGQYGARTTRTNPDDPTTSVLYVASPIKLKGEIIGVLTVCKPADSVTLFMRTAKKKIIIAAVLAAVAVVFLGIVISSWITWPIQKLTNYANAVRDGQRVSAPRLGRSEIGALGSAFEEMRDALEGKEYVENYVQTLTHEMKSPLSAIQGAAELLEEEMSSHERKKFLNNIRAESDRIQDFVDRLLQLSSLERRKGLRDVEDINLQDVLRELVESMNPLLSSKQGSVTVGKTEPMVIKGERFLIRQSLSNLLRNAIDFSLDHSEISISLEEKGTCIEISISNKGPSIPNYALNKVFDRFYSLKRADTGKRSSGLGLTFVREAATLHGGKAELKNRSGGGVIAILSLPVIPLEPAS